VTVLDENGIFVITAIDSPFKSTVPISHTLATFSCRQELQPNHHHLASLLPATQVAAM
jgi:hypothetical protein